MANVNIRTDALDESYAGFRQSAQYNHSVAFIFLKPGLQCTGDQGTKIVLAQSVGVGVPLERGDSGEIVGFGGNKSGSKGFSAEGGFDMDVGLGLYFLMDVGLGLYFLVDVGNLLGSSSGSCYQAQENL